MKVNNIESAVVQAPAILNAATATQATQSDAQLEDAPPSAEAPSVLIRLKAKQYEAFGGCRNWDIQVAKYLKESSSKKQEAQATDGATSAVN